MSTHSFRLLLDGGRSLFLLDRGGTALPAEKRVVSLQRGLGVVWIRP